MTTTDLRGRMDLSIHGIHPIGDVVWNASTPALYEHAIARGEARIGEGGPMVVDTGKHTGRSPQDKFIVREPASEEPDLVGGQQGARRGIVRPPPRQGHRLPRQAGDAVRRRRVRGRRSRAQDRGARRHDASVPRALREDDVHRSEAEELAGFAPQALVLHAPALEAIPEEDGTRTGTFIVLHPSRTEVLIGGTFYAGEIKKSIFTVHERPAAARRGLPDALLGERRQRRPRRRLLRPLRHRQDDALRRPGARADRRRRARLGQATASSTSKAAATRR